jgi:hypothetical protein
MIIGSSSGWFGDFPTHELGRDLRRQARAEGLAAVQALQVPGLLVGFAQLAHPRVLADRDVLHLRGHDALARIVHLTDVGARFRAPRRMDVREAQGSRGLVGGADAAVDRARALELLGVAARFDPRRSQRRQAGNEVDARVRVGVRARGVVDRDRRIWLQPLRGARRRQRNFAHRHADALRTSDVDLAAVRKGLAHLRRQLFGLVEDVLRDCTHDVDLSSRGRKAQRGRNPGKPSLRRRFR